MMQDSSQLHDPDGFTPGERVHDTHWTIGSVDLTTILDPLMMRKIHHVYLVMGVTSTPLHIQDVQGSNLGPNTGYPDWRVHNLPQSVHKNPRIIS
jgi:hypothetical protein